MALYEGVVARLASVLEAGAKADEVRDCDFDVAANVSHFNIEIIPLNMVRDIMQH